MLEVETSDPVAFTAVNIYCWGEQEQRSLVRGGLQQCVASLKTSGDADMVWYSSFDARGPHVFVLVRSQRAATERVRTVLRDSLSSYLLESPSELQLTETALLTRHRDCRGHHLCEADLSDVILPNNTLTMCEHDASGFPFAGLPARHPRPDPIPVLGDIAAWSMSLANDDLLPGIISWAQAMTVSLQNLSGSADRYWQYYANSLVVGGLGFHAALPCATRRTELTRLLGPKRLESLARLWESAGPAATSIQLSTRLLACAGDESSQTSFGFLRQIHHSLSISHGLYGPREFTFVLYAWLRSLEEQAVLL